MSKIVLDISMGDAALGMCIDFYGRFQSEVIEASGRSGRIGFVLPRGGSSLGADPIGLLRGAPHRELALEFMRFVVSEEGQKLWGFRQGTPGGPERYALRRLPILKSLYAPRYEAYRSDPDEQPYDAGQFIYREAWTGRLFSTIAFIVRVMCIDSATELEEAFSALIAAGFPPRATQLFDDVSLVDYAEVTGPITQALRATDALEEVRVANRLVQGHRELYRRVRELAEAGR
jgi:spermidine/putrescine-binding protein